MENEKQYTVEDVRAYATNLFVKEPWKVWTDILPTLRAKFPEQLIIKFMKSS